MLNQRCEWECMYRLPRISYSQKKSSGNGQRARSTRNAVARSEKTRQAENPNLSETLGGTRTAAAAARVAGRRAEIKPSHQRSHLSLAQSTGAQHKDPTNPIPRCRSGKWKGTPYTFNRSASIEDRPFAIGSFAANVSFLQFGFRFSLSCSAQ